MIEQQLSPASYIVECLRRSPLDLGLAAKAQKILDDIRWIEKTHGIRLWFQETSVADTVWTQWVWTGERLAECLCWSEAAWKTMPPRAKLCKRLEALEEGIEDFRKRRTIRTGEPRVWAQIKRKKAAK